jgi:hypothetical protein
MAFCLESRLSAGLAWSGDRLEGLDSSCFLDAAGSNGKRLDSTRTRALSMSKSCTALPQVEMFLLLI